MTSIRFLEFLLLFLLHQVHSEEVEPVFKAKGSVIEMGYCFGVDYIVVYRVGPEGDQLLGNSSADATPVTPPEDLQGRIRINKNEYLLGLQISHLTHMDSGTYRRECWQNRTLTTRHEQQLFVCDKEVESEEIIVKKEDGATELLCNSTSIGLEGNSVHWYHELYPDYKLTLFLDSSMLPLVEELQGVVEVRDGGALLLLNNSMLKYNHQFYCLVIKGKSCLSFQNMYLPDNSVKMDTFASQGDRVVLHCPSDGNNQQWETPLGKINDSSVRNNQMYISSGDKSEDFSLVIPKVSDDHIGVYSCISPSNEVQYSLALCTSTSSKVKKIFEGRHVLLHCDVGEVNSERVQWYRLEPSGGHELIHDSNDKTVAIPEDLRGRLTLSKNGSTLTISHLEPKDEGLYWCVVLGGPEFLEEGDVYEDDYTDYGEDDSRDNDFGVDDWHDTHRCILKQETFLSLTSIINHVDIKPVTVEPVNQDNEPSPKTDSSGDPNVTAYAVGAALVGLLVVGVIVAVIAVKRRAKAPPKQRGTAATRSGLNTSTDIKMDVEEGCTEMLNPNDPND